jgi:dihydrodipicolinate synthase/N-acetylneuraminate lyase
MKKIQDRVPQLRGLKHSSSIFPAVADFVEMGLDCFIGSAFLMAPALALGAVGCVDGPLCIRPDLWVDIWNAHREGDGAGVLAAQKRATEFSWFSRVVQFPAGFKTLAGARFGVDCGDPRPPFAPATAEQKSALIADAKEQGWLND